MLLKITTIVVAIVAVFFGVVHYKKDVMVLGKMWQYTPSWLHYAAMTLYSGLGIHSAVEAMVIMTHNLALDPNEDDLSQVDYSEIYVKDILVGVYRPKTLMNNDKAPAVIFLHGGGFFTGGITLYNGVIYRLARIAEVVVFLPEYRLAPKHLFPAAANDCYETTVQLVNNATQYRIDASRIMLFGDSAGGNLAAVVSQQIASIKKTRLQFAFAGQILLYPTLQFFDFSLKSFEQQETMRKLMAICWSMYITGTTDYVELLLSGNHSNHLRNTRYPEYLQLGNKNRYSRAELHNVPESIQKALTDYRASPLLADDLSENPPTLIMTGDKDVLSDEGKIYGERLESFNVKVKHLNYPLDHGFLFPHFNDSYALPEVKRAFQDLTCYIRETVYQHC